MVGFPRVKRVNATELGTRPKSDYFEVVILSLKYCAHNLISYRTFNGFSFETVRQTPGRKVLTNI